MTTSPPRPYALCWVSAASDPSTIRTWHCCFRSLCLPEIQDVGGGAYTAAGWGRRFSRLSHVRRCFPSTLSGKVKLKIAIKENVTVSAAGSEPVASDSNANAIRLTDNFLRALPTEVRTWQPVLSKFISPAAAGTAGISLVLDGLEADQLDDIPSSSIKRITIDKNPYAAEISPTRESSRGNYDEVGLADIVSRWHCLICAAAAQASGGRESWARAARPGTPLQRNVF